MFDNAPAAAAALRTSKNKPFALASALLLDKVSAHQGGSNHAENFCCRIACNCHVSWSSGGEGA
jgi:hypothetical protein